MMKRTTRLATILGAGALVALTMTTPARAHSGDLGDVLLGAVVAGIVVDALGHGHGHVVTSPPPVRHRGWSRPVRPVRGYAPTRTCVIRKWKEGPHVTVTRRRCW